MLLAVSVRELQPTGYSLSSKLDLTAFKSSGKEIKRISDIFLSGAISYHRLFPRGKHMCPLWGKELRNTLHHQHCCQLSKENALFQRFPIFRRYLKLVWFFSLKQGHLFSFWRKKNMCLKSWGGLILAGCWVPTKAALSPPNSALWGEKIHTEGSRVDIRTGRVTHRKQTWFGEISLICCQSNQSRAKRNKPKS